MPVLIIAEHDNKKLKEVTLHAVSAALKLEASFDILVLGFDCEAVAQEAAHLAQVKKVLVADAEPYAHQLAENSAECIAFYGKDYSHILATASTFSKNILPRCAALLDVNMLSEVVSIESADTFVRPLFAGNLLATVQSPDAIK